MAHAPPNAPPPTPVPHPGGRSTAHAPRNSAALRVTPVTELDAAFVKWNATYDVEREHREASSALVHGVFTAGLAALRERFAG
ncbi:hypothetical protein KV557_20935 [Kitasatospora aureofaciens]|uniref:hypothetical protein n=1 Tax=Kitasatospora aureofaciens TaxID=1894 RepID=UPI001C456735|nr:hypothetical protein [Kitasatospora aureofaciens]MBV6699530.1 hypothetical protein [Kitasatospora aureofaciens]